MIQGARNILACEYGGGSVERRRMRLMDDREWWELAYLLYPLQLLIEVVHLVSETPLNVPLFLA